MSLLLSTLIAFVFVFSACSTADRRNVAKECKYMVLQYPSAQTIDRLGEMTRSQCREILSNIIETPEFLNSYEFVRLIQSQYPPNLTLVVKPLGTSTPMPLLIKSGGARDRVFTAVDQSVDYDGRAHRYHFGRFAVDAVQGILKKGWDYRLVLSIDARGR